MKTCAKNKLKAAKSAVGNNPYSQILMRTAEDQGRVLSTLGNSLGSQAQQDMYNIRDGLLAAQGQLEQDTANYIMGKNNRGNQNYKLPTICPNM